MNRKQYERETSSIKQEYKGHDSKRTLKLNRLDSKYEYWSYIDQYREVDHVSVPGLSHDLIPQDDANHAVSEVLKVHKGIHNTDNYSNIRFYINKPYYSRSGDDPFPCYTWNHPAVKNICKLVSDALGSDIDLERLNVIVRCYSGGDVLGFHSDRKEFGEDIYGMVIYQSHTNGLILVDKENKCYFAIDESVPISWHLTGDSRWKWIHGYATLPKSSGVVRISVTYRHYQDTKQIPKIRNHIN